MIGTVFEKEKKILSEPMILMLIFNYSLYLNINPVLYVSVNPKSTRVGLV